MNAKEIRHWRIVELRNRALKGLERKTPPNKIHTELMIRCVQWGISKATAANYLAEVVESIEKRAKVRIQP